ncbi:MAG TPA: hypothetical protein VHP58_02040 [Alphaproteobacteria bacterium]|nr:hypothetical protein [Alphaproteobacteria bacterium]
MSDKDNNGFLFQIEDIPGRGPRVLAVYGPGESPPTGIELEANGPRVIAALMHILQTQFGMTPESFRSFGLVSMKAPDGSFVR